MGQRAEQQDLGVEMKSRVILIVDDEESIRKTLESVFADEGFATISAASGLAAIDMVRDLCPDLVLLDIWMPGMDGIETLEKLIEIAPKLPVIMMSGHATISTAVKSTQLGAYDFIEKPLDLTSILKSVSRALESKNKTMPGEQVELALSQNEESVELSKVVFGVQKMRGRRFPQQTLAHSAILYGQGLHTGQKSGLILEPLPPNSGIHFASVSKSEIVPAHVEYVQSTGYATTVRLGDTYAGTIEHLMSALHAYGISNLLIKCNGEVPVMDGSSLEFCSLFEEIGIEEQSEDWFEIEVKTPLEVGSGDEFVRLEPADEFIIDYTLKYPSPLGEQHFVYNFSDPETYKREIAPARTFGFVQDIGWLQKQGLALGGRFDNFVLFGPDGPINCKLRFDNEPVRHKILDLIGDIFLLGRRIRGKITASMTGHSDNITLLGKLNSELLKSA